MIGETVAHYTILDKLGEGGMGEVWRAEDTKLGRQVAIKVLPEAFTEDAERLARFEREARVLAAFEHPRIASIYGLEDHDGRKLLVMQVAEEAEAIMMAAEEVGTDEAILAAEEEVTDLLNGVVSDAAEIVDEAEIEVAEAEGRATE